MTTHLHDIRLLAGFEIVPDTLHERVLSREQVSQLAEALAADLARAVPAVDQSILVVAGSLLEPAEMLRPGLPVWAAMADLAGPAKREQDAAARILAVGAHQGRLPDRRLLPPARQPLGQFIGIPLLLTVNDQAGPALEQSLETTLFDQGSVAPPARALLEQYTGAESVHGQLLTLNDLLALQHVQMDAAGLSAFWPVVEQVLLAPDADADFSLPTGLVARWNAATQQLEIGFIIFDRFDQPPENYPLWQRAFRTLTGLADAHGLKWLVHCDPDLALDRDQQALTHDAGGTSLEDGLTEQSDPMVGLIAWTIVESGRLRHVYPLTQAAVAAVGAELKTRHAAHAQRPNRLCHAGHPARLQPA